MQSTSLQGADAVPRHVAIIMDGNGRWAEARGMIRVRGHQAGARAVTAAITEAVRLGIKTLTLFAFSSENWKRPRAEVSALMQLLSESIKRESKALHDNGVRVCVIGEKSALAPALQKQIAEVEELTAGNTRLKLNIALNYGGKWDIVQACRALAHKIQTGELTPADISEDSFHNELALTEDVDLLIRTGGEMRISNFLLWQCAYSEFYVTKTLWPDFDGAALDAAIAFYQRRERRFGMTSSQLRKDKDGV